MLLAAPNGGRANRPGVNALYLSFELETALAEYKQKGMMAVVSPEAALPISLIDGAPRHADVAESAVQMGELESVLWNAIMAWQAPARR